MSENNILFSFYYVRDLDLPTYFAQFDPRPRVFADSGAFSAVTLGAEIDLPKYAQWAADGAQYFDLVANLDVIGNPSATWRNQKRLESLGIAPVPVFHTLEPWRWLDRYIDEGYPLLGLGGCVGHARQHLLGFYQRCFDRVAKKNSPMKFHGFGASSFRVLTAFPWYSVDSSSWGSGYRYARLRLFDPVAARERAFSIFDARQVLPNADLIRHYGEDPDKLISREHYHFPVACRLAARSTRAIQAHCRRLHGPVTIDGGEPGMHVFIADSNPDQLAIGANS